MNKSRTYPEWLKQATERLLKENLNSARIDAELILSSVTNKSRTQLITNESQTLNRTQTEQAEALLARRLQFEPMAYVLGHKEFYGLNFKTDKRALIPRGESESLIEAAIGWLAQQQQPQIIAEVGTGSGALILTLAKKYPLHHYYATELSPEALTLARENAEQLNIANITFLEGDLGQPLLDSHLAGKVNLLIANLPYIPTNLLINLEPTVTYFEPNIALEGGATGLELYEKFFPQAALLLASNGQLLCEHDYDQSKGMAQLCHTFFPLASITTLRDGLGHDRVLSCSLLP